MTRPGGSSLRAAFAGAAVGTGVGGWWGGWLALAHWAARSSLFLDLASLPPRVAAATRVDLSPALAEASKAMGLSLPLSTAALLPVLAGLGLLVGGLIGAGVGVSRLDPEALSLRSLGWAVRTVISWPTWLALIAIAALPITAVFADDLNDVVSMIELALPVGAMTAAPFVVCRRAVVSGPAPGRWWRGERPRLLSVGAFLLLLLAFLALGTVLDAMQAALPVLTPILLVVTVVVTSLVTATQTAVLLRNDVMFLRSSVLPGWPHLGPWCALTLLLALGAVLAAAPVAAAYLVSWKVLPPLVSALDAQGLELPWLHRAAIAAAQWVGRYRWLLFGPLLAVVYWLAAGRLGWLQDFLHGQGRPAA